MNAVSYTTATGNHETVEGLIRYAAARFTAIGVGFPPARMSKLIRKVFRNGGPAEARAAVDDFLDRESDRSWRGFELYTAAGHADPTGAHAARRVDYARGVL